MSIARGLSVVRFKNPYTDELPSLLTQLYGGGQQGAMFIPKPIVLGQQTLFQDAAGTLPVTADGDPVGLMMDLSGNGNHASQPVSAARLIYRTDGALHWLQGDGQQQIQLTYSTPITQPTTYCAGIELEGGLQKMQVLGGNSVSLRHLPFYIDATRTARTYAGASYFTIGDYESLGYMTPSVITCRIDGEVSLHRRNGHKSAEGGLASNGSSGLSILGPGNTTGNTTGYPARGKLYGIIAVHQSAGDYDAMEQYIADLSGVVL